MFLINSPQARIDDGSVYLALQRQDMAILVKAMKGFYSHDDDQMVHAACMNTAFELMLDRLEAAYQVFESGIDV